MDYLSETLSEEQLFKLTFDKGKSNDSVTVLRSALSNFNYFTMDEFNKSKTEVLEDLMKEYAKNRDTRAPLVLLNNFRNWLAEDHPNIKLKGNGRPLKAKRGKSQKDYLSQVKKWLRLCGGIKIDADDFRDFISIPNSDMEEEDEADPVNHEELKLVILHTKDRIRRAKWYFMKCTGARHLETLRVKKKYVDFSQKPPKVRLPKAIVKGKQRTRYVYLDEEAEAVIYPIWNNLSDEDFLFRPNDSIDTNFRNSENRLWAKMVKRPEFVEMGMDKKGDNGFLKKRIHSIRSFAMKAVEKGTGDPIMGDAYGGHKKFVGKYLDKTDDEKIEIFKKSQRYMLLFSKVEVIDNEELKEKYENRISELETEQQTMKSVLDYFIKQYGLDFQKLPNSQIIDK